MKIKVLCLLSIIAFFVIACEESDSDLQSLKLSESSFSDISSGGDVLKVEIVCNSSWEVSSSPQWCTFDVTEGKGNHQLNITVIDNIDSSERTGEIAITSGVTKKTIQIKQQASTATEEFHYKLPVIFHVLYSNPNDDLQYINKGWMAQLLDAVNRYYEGSGISPNMNLEFTLATTMPKTGETLEEPGVERIRWTKNYPINCEAFMTDNNENYTYLLWDPNQYINVMVYNFTQSGTNTTLGISHLPFATKDNQLDGLTVAPSPQLVLANLKYPHCVSLNSLYINERSNNTTYSTTDVVVTLAHELGHYLGLHHVFSDSPTDPCADTDYCDDTPNYDKSKYDNEYFADAFQNRETQPEKWTMKYLVKRQNCDGSWFDSHNLMDYVISYSDQFTVDQNTRIRHVLTYSPFIPGPKKGQSSTRSVVSEEPLDLPISIAK